MSELTTKRPVAFRVQRPPESAIDGHEWQLFNEESEARAEADAKGCDYQGLYVKDGEPTSDLREALKPCPFCGSPMVAQGATGKQTISVWCMKCGARGPDVPFPDFCDAVQQIDQCHKKWNTRAALSAQPQPEAMEADQIQRAMDMLGDVPGNTILERVERIVSYYLALQCELEKVRAVPPIAPDERMRMACTVFVEAFGNSLDEDFSFWSANTSNAVRSKLYSLWAKANAEIVCRAPNVLSDGERMRRALRNIAEGNLGDAPGQANYARIKQVALTALSGAADASKTSAETRLREELKVSIEKRLSEGDGVWRSCSGCHETIDGWSPAPVSEIFKCQLGGGCAECGGLGAIWDSTDYSKFARFVPDVVVNALSPAGADKPTIGGTAFCGHGVMASICDKCAADGKESEGGVESRHAAKRGGEASSGSDGDMPDPKILARAGVAAGPSDPSPPDATAQRDAVRGQIGVRP